MTRSIYSVLVAVLLLGAQSSLAENRVQAKVNLGRQLFMDTSLSEPAGQACASCHRPDQAFADPGQVVTAGANPSLFGNRNSPSISYTRFNPRRYWSARDQTWIGGFFLDGRARTLAEQAQKPFLNPLEMGNTSAQMLMQKIRSGPNAAMLERLYGSKVWFNPERGLKAVADAIATYELRGEEFATFSSKYDAYLRGESSLSAQELRGLRVFEDETKGNCAACHPNRPGKHGEAPLFTDFSYDNLGVPFNPALPFLQMPSAFNPEGVQYRDGGLGKIVMRHPDQELGKFKVPTLRNISRTVPYMHNGVFSSLREVVEFYNTRDVDSRWDPPEIAINVNHDELGNLGLSAAEVDDLLAFLQTLDDGYAAKVD